MQNAVQLHNHQKKRGKVANTLLLILLFHTFESTKDLFDDRLITITEQVSNLRMHIK